MKLIFLICITLTLIACGSSGDGLDSSSGISFSGNNSPASVNESNAKDIGVAAGESVQEAANSASLPSAVSIDSDIQVDYSELSELNGAVLDHANQMLVPLGVVVQLDNLCITGSVSANVPNVTSGPATVIFTYSRCRMSGTFITATGKATVRFNNIANKNAGYTVKYSNFKISSPSSGTYTLNLLMDCSSSNNCTYNSDFIGSDGRTHRVSALSFSGNASSGFNGTATFYHARHGRTTISVSYVTYGTCGNKPDGGSLTFIGASGSSGFITFNSDCTASGTWTNGSISGSF